VYKHNAFSYVLIMVFILALWIPASAGMKDGVGISV